MPRKQARRMKKFRGWCVVSKANGHAWYEYVVPERWSAVDQHNQANDGSGRFTRIARVEVRELPPAKKARKA